MLNGENIPVICTDYDKRSPATGQVSCILTDDWTLNIRYGVAAIIKEVSGIGGSAVNTQYFSAEMAINRFLYKKIDGEVGRGIQ